jgi:hypothetical protein
MVLYEIYREDGGNGITFVHMLYMYREIIDVTILYDYIVRFGEKIKLRF